MIVVHPRTGWQLHLTSTSEVICKPVVMDRSSERGSDSSVIYIAHVPGEGYCVVEDFFDGLGNCTDSQCHAVEPTIADAVAEMTALTKPEEKQCITS